MSKMKAVAKAISNREHLTPEHGAAITSEHLKRKKDELKAKEAKKTAPKKKAK